MGRKLFPQLFNVMFTPYISTTQLLRLEYTGTHPENVYIQYLRSLYVHQIFTLFEPNFSKQTRVLIQFQHCKDLRTRNVVSNSSVCSIGLFIPLVVVCYVNNGLCHVPQPGHLTSKRTFTMIFVNRIVHEVQFGYFHLAK